MKLATTTSDFFAWGLDDKESILAILEAGFRYIDYNFGYDFKNRTGFYGENWQAFGDELLEMSQKLNFKFVQAHAPMGYPIREDEYREQFIKDTKRSIEAAAYLSIPNIVVHAGHINGISKEENFQKNKIFYLDILKTAEKCGINILTENFNKMCIEGYYWSDSAADINELVDYINHPLLKVCWDTGHANQQPLPQYDALKILGNKVAALHVQDNMGVTDDHTLPFMGTLNIDSLMRGLIDIGYNGYFTFEADSAPLNAARRSTDKDTLRCTRLPLEFRKTLEKFLYDAGKYILSEYNCFEE